MALPDGLFLVWFFIAVLVGYDGVIIERVRVGPIIGYDTCQRLVDAYEAETEEQQRGIPIAYCRYAILTVEQLSHAR